ncbi:MAG TPA: glycogen debranching protein GlgX [Aestuariivirga sp.]|nr:glycogen debranching protein GlgX [Aestuariivirga sp.]
MPHSNSGSPFPLGVTPVEGGVNVAVVSRHATRIFFCLFEGGTETRFELAAHQGGVYCGLIPGVRVGQRYGLRAEGPYDATNLFDVSKLLIDPYATAIDRSFTWHGDFAVKGTETSPIAPKCIVAATLPPARRLPYRAPRFIYEVAVKAFTKRHPLIPENIAGTVAALAHPACIEHFLRLGIDTVELMPLMAWADERHLARQGLSNAWGYNPISFFAPDPRLAPGGVREIRETIAALHDAGLRVVLDVVFNHTGESDLGGPTVSLRGLDNALYYRHAHGVLMNDTGCGNTLDTNSAPVMELILASMRHWVTTVGIDGFRYDLATVLGRGVNGYDANAPLLRAIQQDPLLGMFIHIAEPWDVGPNGYQLGNFPSTWHEWNDRYRDDVRHFWRGDAGASANFATRLAGSSDIFGRPDRRPSSSINYVAAHDGFTLRDFVSHDHKNNFANGEDNRDGNSREPSWISEDPDRDVKALLASLFLSRGTVMLTAGDEFGRSQCGNNNAYAQDNETTWLDWANADQNLIQHVAGLAKFRGDHAAYFADRFLTGQASAGQHYPDIQWLLEQGGILDWTGPSSDVFGLILSCAEAEERLLVWFNRKQQSVDIALPAAQPGFHWGQDKLTCEARSVAMLLEVADVRKKSSAPDDGLIHDLAAAAGIQSEWWEVSGAHHSVGIDTKRALLAAMALPIATQGEVRDSLNELAAGQNRNIAVTAGRCYQPEFLKQGKRLYGLTSHLYALRHEGDSGIGDLETLARFCQTSARLGGSLAGINPLHHMFTDDRRRVSPYQPSDRRFIDPIYIDLNEVQKRFGPSAKQKKYEGELSRLREASHVDYEAVWRIKDDMLFSLFEKFGTSKNFEIFIADGGTALQDHARFEARTDSKRYKYAQWLQWIADGQLATAAKRAEKAGLELGIYRDLALGCAYEGGEVWARPELFATTVSMGAPPDPFARDGQVWNLPPFNPLALARAEYEPFAEILRANMRHAKVLRIDHILGLSRQFWVPRGASGADGAYVTMPLERLLAITAAESIRAKCLVIGEDLGTVPDGLRECLSQANILSYRVLWFEQDEARFQPPESYPQGAAVCLSSHDLAPFKGWRESANQVDIAKLESAITEAGVNSGDLLADAHAFVAKTPCAIMLVQADDLSEETEPLNVPGTDKERPNWRRRLSVAVEALPDLTTSKAVRAAIQHTGRGKNG